MIGGRKLGLRTVLLFAICASVVLCGVLVHVSWLGAVRSVSQTMLGALEERIADATRREWWFGVVSIEKQVEALTDSLVAGAESGLLRKTVAAAHALGTGLGWIAAARDGRPIEMEAQTDFFQPGHREAITGWLQQARGLTAPSWIRLLPLPEGGKPAVGYAYPISGGVILAAIPDELLQRRLADIPVGRTGGTFVLSARGEVIIAARAVAAGREGTATPSALLAAAEAAGRVVARRAPGELDRIESLNLEIAGQQFAIRTSPLWFQGWQLAIILPEADYLSVVDGMIARVTFGIAFFVLLVGAVAIWATRRFVAVPIGDITNDLRLVERFDLEGVMHRTHIIREFDLLSSALTRMSAGLADFAKFIPTELVRKLITQGARAEPGGRSQDITVLFADLAGFTALSERLGDRTVAIVSRFLDFATEEIVRSGGTVDKYIGDAVMAFWGAPVAQGDHARLACQAALAIQDRFRAIHAHDPDFAQLGLRIGLESGPAIIGMVGSARRLNYTALGDTVNLASRLEGVNKVYGTTIAIGPHCRALSDNAVHVRELDWIRVYGRSQEVPVFELFGLAEEPIPDWIARYDLALRVYRDGQFSEAEVILRQILSVRPEDGPTLRLLRHVQRLLAQPPASDWQAVTELDMK
jgi:adenylate cyclase